MSVLFAQSFVNNPWVVQLAVFGVIAIVVWLVVEWRTAPRSGAAVPRGWRVPTERYGQSAQPGVR